MGTATAIIAAASIAAGSSYYQSEEQKRIAKNDRKRRESEAAAQQAEADRIAKDTKPPELALTDTKFGASSSDNNNIGNANEFFIPKTSALGGTKNARSGLGFTV